ncbi:MAG: hypothetical protein G01um101419_131 [Parcubacteria group bacterium Gr01-1014_19]|nr:MAG: hypothetical protein G01um101419_131 [Parcubacteria group bacterium Gr01-1014_19]
MGLSLCFLETEMWNLINNNLKIFIDPLTFIGLKNLEQRILLINTFQDYLTKIDPSLCDVTFFFPKYIEDKLGVRRTFFPQDKVTLIENQPEAVIDVFPIHPDVVPTELGKAGKMLNEFLSIAIKNKCVLYLTENEFDTAKKGEIEKQYGLQIVNLLELYKKIESYTQGFYNYFKFRNSVYGINSSDIAHAMSDEFHNKVLISLESEINKKQPSEELKERVRSFVHNRYIDILTTIDQINFFKLQQIIYDVEHELIKDGGNKRPHLHGYIRYYLNYYLFLLWGAIDHLAWIINDIFSFGYSPSKSQDRKAVGLHNSKKEFLAKIKAKNVALYDFIVSNDFQEWLYFFGQLRHKNAHREMFSASPLLITTDESTISDDEIDKIIYKDEPPVPKDIAHMFSPELIEHQKILDRINYRISKSKKGIDHFALIEKDGQQFMFDPVGRIATDMSNLRNLVQKIFEAYKTE